MRNDLNAKPSNDPIFELAASDFQFRMARYGRPRKRGTSIRIGNLLIVTGVPMTVAYYAVLKGQSGQERVRFLDDPSEADIARLSEE